MTANSTQIDHTLLQRIAGGDENAFRILFETYWPQVYGTSLRITRSPEQAKDLSQEIFLRVWEYRNKLTEVVNVQSYLYILSKNYIMDHLKKKVFDPSNINYLIRYSSNEVINPQEATEYRELENKYNEAIEKLPSKVKEVFRLSRVEGLTHDQIAVRLNISVVSSKTYIVRALEHIRKYMAGHPEHIIVFLIWFWF